VLFAIEDLHWADRSTLEFVSSLLGGLHDERPLLVCTYRSDELHRRHPLRPFLAEAERRELVERIELAPFSPVELAAQVAGSSAAPPHRSSSRACTRAARATRASSRSCLRPPAAQPAPCLPPCATC
jgi:hypothetical protein